MIKRVLSIALALMLVIGCFAGVVSADEQPTYTAGLSYVDANWAYQTWGTDATCEVSGPGTYTLSLDIPEGTTVPLTGATVILVDIGVEGGDAADVLGQYILSDVKLILDGTEIAVDQTKVQHGNMEEKGRFRIDLYNEWGDSATGTKANPCIDAAAISFSENLTVQFTLSEPAESYTSALALVASDWSTNTDFREASSVQQSISKDGGTYTLTYEGTSIDIGILVVDILGAASELGALNKTLQLDALTLAIDGNEVAVDLNKVLTGDLENNGNWRIDLYNMYGDSKNDPGIDNTIAVTEKLELTYTVSVVDMPTETPVVPDEPVVEIPEFDPAASYDAYLMLQTPGWTFRNAWNEEFYGIDGTGWADISNTWGQYLVHADAEKAGMTWGTITDATVAGNGTYSVKITDFGTVFADDFANNGQDFFNIIGVSTNIPLNDTIQITDVKLIVDGSTRHTQATWYQDPDSTDYVKILIQNIWNDEVKEIGYYPAPSDSLEIQFTVSGFSYDNAEQGNEETVPTTPATSAPAEQPAGGNGATTGIIIAVVAIAVVAVVVIVVMKKKKA